MRVIDSHTHPFGNSNTDLTGKIQSRRDGALLRQTDPETFSKIWDVADDLTDDLIQDMDENGVEMALIQSPPGRSPDFFSDAIRRNPGRLVGISTVTKNVIHLYDEDVPENSEIGKTALLENFESNIRYQIEELGYKGIGEGLVDVFSQSTAVEDIVSDLLPVMEILNKYQVPVMIATAWNQFGKPIHKGIPLFVDDLAIAFPKLPIILTKMGRGFNFIFEACLVVAFKHQNVYLDTVQAPAHHIDRAVREIGANRVLFGSDWDRIWGELGRADGKSNIYTQAFAVMEEAQVPKEEKEWIYWRTTAELYGLDVG